jgi:homoserine kinase
VFGGLVAATDTGIQRLELHESLKPIVAIPNQHLKTDQARAAGPGSPSTDGRSRCGRKVSCPSCIPHRGPPPR